MEAELELAKRLGHQKFKILFKETDIIKRIEKIADQINKDFNSSDPLIIIGVLKGSFIFIADLVRRLKIPTHIEFIGASSYSKTQSTGKVSITRKMNSKISGKNVLLVEDIVDSGTTIKVLVDLVNEQKPRQLKICSLFVKPSKMKDLDVKIDYSGFELGDHFIVGYGLDYEERYREIPHVIEILGLPD